MTGVTREIAIFKCVKGVSLRVDARLSTAVEA